MNFPIKIVFAEIQLLMEIFYKHQESIRRFV